MLLLRIWKFSRFVSSIHLFCLNFTNGARKKEDSSTTVQTHQIVKWIGLFEFESNVYAAAYNFLFYLNLRVKTFWNGGYFWPNLWIFSCFVRLVAASQNFIFCLLWCIAVQKFYAASLGTVGAQVLIFFEAYTSSKISS